MQPLKKICTWPSIGNRQLTKEANPLVEFGWLPKLSDLKHTLFCAFFLLARLCTRSLFSVWPWCTAWGCQESQRESELGGFPGRQYCCFQAFSLWIQAGQQASLACLASPAAFARGITQVASRPCPKRLEASIHYLPRRLFPRRPMERKPFRLEGLFCSTCTRQILYETNLIWCSENLILPSQSFPRQRTEKAMSAGGPFLLHFNLQLFRQT